MLAACPTDRAKLLSAVCLVRVGSQNLNIIQMIIQTVTHMLGPSCLVQNSDHVSWKKVQYDLPPGVSDQLQCVVVG